MEEFFGDNIPSYAILSHTWGEEEVTFQDWSNTPVAQSKTGYAKITGTCAQARDLNIRHVWVDTNCIDKSSSAELSEAINSMFGWYAASRVCLVYLDDVDTKFGELDPQIRASRWFTRGWTLQELLAPEHVVFFDKHWNSLGTRADLQRLVAQVTSIRAAFLAGTPRVPFRGHTSISERMSWVARRRTTRFEDTAYCMLGLSDIHMPLLYGEGSQAFQRLQEEIIRTSNDQTIFCWWSRPEYTLRDSVLAPSPAAFLESAKYYQSTFQDLYNPNHGLLPGIPKHEPYAVTNADAMFKLHLASPLTREAYSQGIHCFEGQFQRRLQG